MFDIILYFGAGIALAIAISNIVTTGPNSFSSERIIRFALFLSVFLWLTWSAIYLSGRIDQLRFMNLFGLPFLFATGPLLFWYFSEVMDEKFTFGFKNIIHLVLPVVVFGMILYSLLFTEENYTTMERITFFQKLQSVPNLLSMLAGLSLNVYVGILVWKYSFLGNKKYLHNKKYFYAVIILFLCELGALLSLAAITGGSTNTLIASNILVTIILIGVYITGKQYPELIHDLAVESRLQKSGKSILENTDIVQLKMKLLDLMENEKIFYDEDLNLGSLAKELNISAHQLSQFLNEYMNKNFNNFINDYRIKEACAMLVEESGRTTLSVAMAVGFNSFSVFHAAFKKQTGYSPGNYRKNYYLKFLNDKF